MLSRPAADGTSCTRTVPSGNVRDREKLPDGKKPEPLRNAVLPEQTGLGFNATSGMFGSTSLRTTIVARLAATLTPGSPPKPGTRSAKSLRIRFYTCERAFAGAAYSSLSGILS